MNNDSEIRRTKNEKGAVALLFAMGLVAMLGVASFALDIGMGLVTKSELQNTSDAAALAGARELALWYKQYPQQIGGTLDPDGASDVEQKAQAYGQLNKAGGVPIEIAADDINLGTYDPKTGVITEPATQKVRTVRVQSRRDDTTNGAVPTRLATVMGIGQMSVRATTAAAVTPLKSLKYGKGDFPIGISKDWFANNSCASETTLKLFPTAQANSCAAWHTFTEKPASASKLKTIVNGMEEGTWSSPETIAGETYYEFIGGTVESRCSDLKALFDEKKVPQNGSGKMTANIPVYDMGCGNANQARLIIGFARAVISKVKCTGGNNNELDIVIECGINGEEIGEGGGGNDFGNLSSVPLMIQ